MKLKILFFINLSIFFSLIIFSKQTYFDVIRPLIICNKYTCPKNRGFCNKENECICSKDYETVDALTLGDFYCNYRKKSKLIAFLLEFILGFGSGHFYLGHINLATIKLIFTTLTCLLFYQYNSIKKITEIKRVAIPLERFCIIGWIIWQLVDGFLLGFWFYKDGNGIELRGW